MINANKIVSRSVNSIAFRSFSTSTCLCGRKSRVPIDKRFTVTAKMVNRHRKGGHEALEVPTALHVVQKTGVKVRANKMFKNIPEMIPEFIVPDLTNFPLKAYVTYTAPEITQTKLTARDLFNSCYAPTISEGIKSGKVQVEGGKIISDKTKKLPDT